jgi:tetratricopeptide (TPR) repeat protein
MSSIVTYFLDNPGGALSLLVRNDEAIKNWEKAVGLDHSFAFAAYNLALDYLEKGDKAKGHWRTVLDIPSS